MESSSDELDSSRTEPCPPTYPSSANISFRFGTRTIQANGTTFDHYHPNVLRLRIHHSSFDRFIKSLFSFISSAIGTWIQGRFPEWFLPEKIVLKIEKDNWEDEFNQEVVAYDKLRSIQGIVIPKFYGMVNYNDRRALVLSDLGGHPLATPEGAVLNKTDLEPLLYQALTSLTELGGYHDDTKLDNFLLVTGEKDKIMIVDLESAGFELSEERLAFIARSRIAWLIQQYEDHLECMEYDGVLLPQRPVRA
ncbi:hypothetical protein FPOAC2_07719 [Fusarium poae]|uniref:hypothetical protein n=1 Tax=Fusarium poae TaxID=36050 RepID=UPI001CE75A15|nr:hypothetical protein FPOAC1_007815 [Fusarium poae]KAG8668436.1 hypothetical protein FPOAC1_007815 [Fusarium poae]